MPHVQAPSKISKKTLAILFIKKSYSSDKDLALFGYQLGTKIPSTFIIVLANTDAKITSQEVLTMRGGGAHQLFGFPRLLKPIFRICFPQPNQII